MRIFEKIKLWKRAEQLQHENENLMSELVGKKTLEHLYDKERNKVGKVLEEIVPEAGGYVKVNGKIFYVNVISVKRNTYSTEIEAYNEYANRVFDDDNK